MCSPMSHTCNASWSAYLALNMLGRDFMSAGPATRDDLGPCCLARVWGQVWSCLADLLSPACLDGTLWCLQAVAGGLLACVRCTTTVLGCTAATSPAPCMMMSSSTTGFTQSHQPEGTHCRPQYLSALLVAWAGTLEPLKAQP